MAKRVPKASKRRLVFLTPFILFITVYFIFTVGYYGYKLISLKNQQVKLNNDLYKLQAEESRLKNDIQKFKNPEYLARYARENFLYSKDGEYVLKIEPKETTDSKENTFLEMLESNYIYIIVIFSTLILLFILFVFKKNKIKNKEK